MRKDNQLKREKAEEYIKKSNPTGSSPPLALVCYTHILQQWFSAKKDLVTFKVWLPYYAALARV
ncbi:hypothetical protein SD211_04110 [Prevotella intermedia]|uniref:hypothetical protein n=1 Tax=Prevotella intermedia TaxID=28131 RepID=UPI00397909ED